MELKAKVRATSTRGVRSAEIDEYGDLIFTMTDGETLNLGSTIEFDETLTVEGAGAEAKATGEAIASTVETVTSLRNALMQTTPSEQNLWTVGTLRSDNGNEDNTATFRMRTPYIDPSIIRVSVSDESIYSLSVYAWNGTTYVGVWNGETFEKALPTPANTKPVYISDLPKTYRYRLVVSHIDRDVDISTAECVNVLFDTQNTVDKKVMRLDLQYATVIPNNTDYDTIKTFGTYYVTSAAAAKSMRNCPIKTAHIMLVFPYNSVSDRTMQLIIQPSDQPHTYMRILYGASFKPWYKSDSTLIPENTPYSRKLNLQVSRTKQTHYTVHNTLPTMTSTVDSRKYYESGARLDGVLYSSVWRDGQDVFRNLTLATYYSALENPCSVLYTKDYTDVGISNAHAWYGAVCSTFVGYQINERLYYSTGKLINLFPDKVMESIYDIEVGDLLVYYDGDESGHIQIITQVYIDGSGRIVGVDVTDEANVDDRTTRTLYYSMGALENHIKNAGYSVKQNPNPGEIAPFRSPGFNAEILFERGNDTYITADDLQDGAWFYIPNKSSVLYRKNGGEYATVTLANVPQKTVNGYTVYNLAECFSGVGNYDFIDSVNSDRSCLIKVINTGTAVLSGTTLSLSGWENCIPKNYYIVREYARTSESQNSAMQPTSHDYVCSYQNRGGEINITEGATSATVTFPESYITDSSTGNIFKRYKLWLEYDTGLGYKQAFSNLVVLD